MGHSGNLKAYSRMEGDSVEARDVIARALYEAIVPPDPWWDGEDDTIKDLWRERAAALAEHGFTVIRTDPETMERMGRAIYKRRYGHTDGFDAGQATYREYCADAEAALVVLRGDPPQPRHLTNSAGGHHNPRDQAILGGDPSL